MTIKVETSSGERLDLFLVRELPDLSRSRIQTLLKQGHIVVNGTEAKPKTSVNSGDQITISLPEPQPAERPGDLKPQDPYVLAVCTGSGSISRGGLPSSGPFTRCKTKV